MHLVFVNRGYMESPDDTCVVEISCRIVQQRVAVYSHQQIVYSLHESPPKSMWHTKIVYHQGHIMQSPHIRVSELYILVLFKILTPISMLIPIVKNEFTTVSSTSYVNLEDHQTSESLALIVPKHNRQDLRLEPRTVSNTSFWPKIRNGELGAVPLQSRHIPPHRRLILSSYSCSQLWGRAIPICQLL